MDQHPAERRWSPDNVSIMYESAMSRSTAGVGLDRVRNQLASAAGQHSDMSWDVKVERGTLAVRRDANRPGATVTRAKDQCVAPGALAYLCTTPSAGVVNADRSAGQFGGRS